MHRASVGKRSHKSDHQFGRMETHLSLKESEVLKNKKTNKTKNLTSRVFCLSSVYGLTIFSLEQGEHTAGLSSVS